MLSCHVMCHNMCVLLVGLPLACSWLLRSFLTSVSCNSTALQWGPQHLARVGPSRIPCEQPWFYLVDQDFLKIASIFFLKFASNFSTKLQLYHKPPDLDEVSNCWLFEPNSLFATVCNHSYVNHLYGNFPEDCFNLHPNFLEVQPSWSLLQASPNHNPLSEVYFILANAQVQPFNWNFLQSSWRQLHPLKTSFTKFKLLSTRNPCEITLKKSHITKYLHLNLGQYLPTSFESSPWSLLQTSLTSTQCLLSNKTWLLDLHQ